MNRNQFLALVRTARLPLAPSAVSNILLGALCAGFTRGDALPLAVLSLASVCFYCSGMAWNDFFDAAVDAVERPDRPIPSGAVPRSWVGWFAGILMGMGIVLVWSLEWSRPAVGISGALAMALVILILAYDSGGKKTPLGPVLMGGCRALNILLGWSVVTGEIGPAGVFQGVAAGIFITGITVMAKEEAGQPERLSVVLGLCLSALGLVGVLLLPSFNAEGTTPWILPYLVFILGARLAIPGCAAVNSPSPATVQKAVVTFLKSLIFLDTLSGIALAGWAGLWCLVCQVFSWALGKLPRQYFT